MIILKKNSVSLDVEPDELFEHFKFSNYKFDSCSFGSYDRWITVFCRTPDSATNNRILMCNIEDNTVDIVAYSGKMGIQEGENFYVADSVTYSVYSTFSGFDDLGSMIDAYWIGRDEMQDEPDQLKKTRKLRFKGYIGVDQAIGVYMNLDKQGFQKVGTIVGNASYVSLVDTQAVGGHYIGQVQVGGDDTTTAFAYFMEIKIRTGKFRKICVKLIPEGIGYFDFNLIEFWDTLLFEDRLPKAFRQKQDVSLDGESTDQ